MKLLFLLYIHLAAFLKVLLGDRESVFALARENFRTYFGRDIGRLCGARWLDVWWKNESDFTDWVELGPGVQHEIRNWRRIHPGHFLRVSPSTFTVRFFTFFKFSLEEIIKKTTKDGNFVGFKNDGDTLKPNLGGNFSDLESKLSRTLPAKYRLLMDYWQ